MQKAIIGKKVGMTQIFDESGKVIPVTVVEAGPCVVTQKKTVETDGYTAVQLGFGDIKEHKLSGASSVKAALKVLEDKELVYRTNEGYFIYDRFMDLWLKRI